MGVGRREQGAGRVVVAQVREPREDCVHGRPVLRIRPAAVAEVLELRQAVGWEAQHVACFLADLALRAGLGR